MVEKRILEIQSTGMTETRALRLLHALWDSEVPFETNLYVEDREFLTALVGKPFRMKIEIEEKK